MSSIFGLLSALSGGAIGQTTIFALGIMPYISASIIFSMLTKVSPALEAVAKEGAGPEEDQPVDAPRDGADRAGPGDLHLHGRLPRPPKMIDVSMRDHTTALVFVVVSALVAGALLVMWIGELITEYGVGNGASLIIMAGIIATLPSSIWSIKEQPDEFWQIMVFLIAVWTVTIFVVVFMHKGARRIPIQYARLTRGRKRLRGASATTCRSR